MGKFFDSIPEGLIPWIQRQKMFWVASAPLSAEGHVNVSPKGYEGTFRIESSTRVWYEDLTGSGIETISHVRENGRMTIMFVAFDGPPRIMRLFGKGTVHEFGTPTYEALLPLEKRQPGSRAIVVLDIDKVGTSCGYSIPLFTFQTNRTALHNFMSKQEKLSLVGEKEKGLKHYWETKNICSIDGLPGLESAYSSSTPFSPVTAGRVYKSESAMRYWIDIRMVIGIIVGVLIAVFGVNTSHGH